MSDALHEAFEDVGVPSLDPDVAADLLSLAVHHGVSETELAQMWEAFVTPGGPGATSAGTIVQAAQLERFGAYVKAASAGQEEEEAAPPPVFARTPLTAAKAQPRFAAPTPAAPTPMVVLQGPAGKSAFSARGERMQAAPALNGHLPECAPGAESDPPRCELALAPPPDAAELGSRYMRERIEDRVDYIEGRLLAFAAASGEADGAPPCDALGAAAPTRVRCVGRVVCEGDGRLNEASVLLEGSVKHSGGARVRLELRDLPSFSLFPGQVVAVEGANPSGYCLVARRLVGGLPGAREAAAPPLRALSLVVAAGPFTCAGDLAYEPLAELLAYCLQRRPDVLLLLGPFVDCEHAAVSGGALDETFDALFDTRVRDALQDYTEQAGPACRVVLLPSTRDAHHVAVFPQPPFEAHRFESPYPDQVLCAPNPAILRAGALEIGACSADALRALSGAEAARGSGDDRMARLAAHLVGQRSFFPLYPAPQGALLDARRGAGLALPRAPHLLVLPSDLAPFAKLLPGGTAASEAAAAPPAEGGAAAEDGASAMETEAPAEAASGAAAAAAPRGDTATICVNPGRLARGSLGGTFAHVHVAAGAGGAGASLGEHVRVDIIRV